MSAYFLGHPTDVKDVVLEDDVLYNEEGDVSELTVVFVSKATCSGEDDEAPSLGSIGGRREDRFVISELIILSSKNLQTAICGKDTNSIISSNRGVFCTYRMTAVSMVGGFVCTVQVSAVFGFSLVFC